MARAKYTDEKLIQLAGECGSVAEILRRLGLKQAGGTHYHIKRRLDRLGVDLSGISGQGWRKGRTFKHERGTPDRLLVLRDDDVFTSGTRLKEAMKYIGIPELCDSCGIGTEWNGKPLTIQVDHINGNRSDDRRENLRFLCPNCHSQTDTFSQKNIRRTT